MNITLDPRRYGNVIARLQQSPSETVQFAVQAALNAEAAEQQQEMFEQQLAVAQQETADLKQKLGGTEPGLKAVEK